MNAVASELEPASLTDTQYWQAQLEAVDFASGLLNDRSLRLASADTSHKGIIPFQLELNPLKAFCAQQSAEMEEPKLLALLLAVGASLLNQHTQTKRPLICSAHLTDRGHPQSYPFCIGLEPQQSHLISLYQQLCADLDAAADHPELPSDLAINNEVQLQLNSPAEQPLSDSAELEFRFQEEGRYLQAELHYAVELFDHRTAVHLSRHFCILTQQLLDEPERPLQEVSLFNPEECFEQSRFNRPADQRGIEPLQQRIAHHAQQTPLRIAASDDNSGEAINYKQLEARSNQIAQLVTRLSGESRGVVALLMERSIGHLTALLGIHKAGCVYLPLDPNDSDEIINYRLADSGATVLITSNDLAEGFDYQQANSQIKGVLCLDMKSRELTEATREAGVTLADQSALQMQDSRPSELSIAPEDAVCLLYSSAAANSANNKVLLQNQSLNNQIHNGRHQFPLHPQSALLQSAPATSAASLWQLLTPLYDGGRCVIVASQTLHEPAALLKALRRYRIGGFETTPALLHKLLLHLEQPEAEPVDLPHLGWSLCSGDAMNDALLERWFEQFPHTPISHGYSTLEVGGSVTVRQYTNLPSQIGHNLDIGRPIPGVVVQILNATQKPVATGQVGEICLSADIDNEEQRMVYASGDLGRWCNDGTLELFGPLEQQLYHHGRRLDLRVTETVLRKVEGVAEVRVIPYQEELIAYFVMRKWQTLKRNLLRTELESQLPAELIPDHFITLEEWPLQTDGRIAFDRLPRPAKETEKSKQSGAFGGLFKKLLG